MILKLKAILYRYTGIYTAHKEELKYVQEELEKLDGKKFKDFSFCMGLGLWQANNGLTTIWCPYSLQLYRLKCGKFRFVWSVIYFVELFTRQLCYDLERTVFRYWHNKKVKKLQELLDSHKAKPKSKPKKKKTKSK